MKYLMIIILIFISKNSNADEYIPLEYYLSKTFILTNPCSIEKSILIRNQFLYKINRDEKRLCISKKLFPNQVVIIHKEIFEYFRFLLETNC